LKTENVGVKRGLKYEACPYCLTEIVIDASPRTVQKTVVTNIGREETDENMEMSTLKAKLAQSVTSAKCTHQLGYLSKRSPKEQIPEECMMCGNIVQCMLKNVTG
jgi:hypothetical protein